VNWSSYPSSASPPIWHHGFEMKSKTLKHTQPTTSTRTWHTTSREEPPHSPVAVGNLPDTLENAQRKTEALGDGAQHILCQSDTHILDGLPTYHVGRQKPRGATTIFQQQLVRYIQNAGLSHSPSHLFVIDFVAQLQAWQGQCDQLLIFIDMNEHILRGYLVKNMLKMGLTEASHSRWGTDNELYLA
jgi:hypothetical protein